MKRTSLVVVAALVLAAWTGIAGASSKKTSLTGAGSTFVAPLVSQWISHYSAASINYSGVGSGAGSTACRLHATTDSRATRVIAVRQELCGMVTATLMIDPGSTK